ncbi:MAG: polysaccharide deacetylase family protein [Nanoarchaeota archaeon]|nr:polysaccharide deacetylase family protein [Nanoarchaeota archaeon]
MKYKDIPILMYHDIADDTSQWNVSLRRFQQQMEWLKKEGYKTITLTQLNDNLEKKTAEKYVVITFDDARSGVYESAFPILQQLGFTATVFVVPRWIEDSKSIPVQENYSGFCTWQQLRAMVAAGFVIGSHSYTHANFFSLSEQEIVHELDTAEQSIMKNLNCQVHHFCYPYGKYSAAVLNLVRQRYETAVTVARGFDKSAGEYARQWVTRETSLSDFEELVRKQTLSVCMIVKNEEAYLAQCLSSVQGLADEIIIVDTGSTDRTKEIAVEFTEKIFQFSWCDDFAAARNESLKQATGDWILILDADEVLNQDQFPLLQQALYNKDTAGYRLLTQNYSNDSSISGWMPVQEKNMYAQTAQGWYPSVKVRLFRRQKEHYFIGRVHEMVDETIQNNAGKMAFLDVPVHHYGTLRETAAKTQTYLELSKQKVTANPMNAKAYYELGIQHKELGDYSRAEEAFAQSLSLDSVSISPRLNLAVVQQKQGKFDSAMENYQQVLGHKKMEPFVSQKQSLSGHTKTNAEAYYGLGFCYFKKGDLKQALNHFLATLQHNPDHLDASINAGAVYEKMGRFTEAVLLLKNAMALNPRSGRAYYNLGVVYQKQLDIARALSCYEKALDLQYGNTEELQQRIMKMKEFLTTTSIS